MALMSFSNSILSALYEGKFCFKVIRKLDHWLSNILRFCVSKKLPIQKNKIVFMNFQNKYVCNHKYIAEEILREGLPIDLVWVVKNVDEQREYFPENIRLVKRGSYAFFKECVSAKIWIDNAINFFYEDVPKRKGQVLINTWHGSMGLKRIGKDDNKNKKWVEKAKRCDKDTDFLISNSTFENEVYRTTYWPTSEILEFGHPRNDIFFIKDEIEKRKVRDKILEKYNLPKDKKFVLYAPTFRDSGTLSCYDLDFDKLVETLKLKFGGDWVVLLRYHFKLWSIREIHQRVSATKNVINATDYDDIQELMFISDIGITDYSSWICDFVLTGRPGFIFATDLEDYVKERGFYYPLEETPFPVTKSNDELFSNIASFDYARYGVKVERFLTERGCIENGEASQKVVQMIKTITGIA